MRFPEAFDGTFGQVNFGDAPVEPRRRRRLVRLADQILAHPQGTLPDKIPDPHQLDAAYRLFKADEVTHAAALATHARLTHQRMATHPGPVVLVAHDDTLLDFSGLQAELGPIGNGHGKGFVCHSSLAVTPRREVLGLAWQILYCHPPLGTPRQRPGPAGRLWRDAIEAMPAPPAPGTKRHVHLADRAGDITEVLDYADEHGHSYVIRSQHDRSCCEASSSSSSSPPSSQEAIAKLHQSAQAKLGADRACRRCGWRCCRCGGTRR